MAEGLAGMVQKAISLGMFEGYKVSSDQHYYLLQFSDNTILVGKGSWNNRWILKSIVRGFVVVSGLKVNFLKSNLFGINLREDFLESTSSFLSCSISSIPFWFLGIPEGANPR